MVIQRDQYVSELLSKRWNGKVKIITGIRRCGKSFLLSNLYKDYLLKEGVEKDCFVELALDKKAHIKYEIDFIVNTGREKVYIQSALNVDTEAKRNQETFSLKNSGDFFRKIVIVDGNTKPWTDDDGIMYVGVIPFLLKETEI
ncbi:MAG: AAA family ATPase [Prevotella sp.]|nr:AAA family ATPase [Prevotella sp.]